MKVEASEWMAHSDFLAHYGVPGMKWGRRKGPSTLDRYKKHKKHKKDDKEISEQEWYGLSNKEYSEYKKKVNSLIKKGTPADDASEIAYDYVVNPSTLDRYKKHKKTEKQYNEDLALYGKKGAKRIADDMDNKTTLKGARSKEAGKYKNAVKSVKKGGRIGEIIGGNAGAIAGYAGYYGLRKLAKKVAKTGKLNAAGEVVAKLDPFIGYNLAGIAGARLGMAVGRSSGKRIAARKNGYTYKDFKKRGV